MKIKLAYGQQGLDIDLPDARTTVIEPRHVAGLADEKSALLHALERPVDAAPLRQWLKPGGRVCVVFTDITRATPNHRIIPWLVDYLEQAGVARAAITLVNALGTHRPNTREELQRMLTPAVVDRYRVINHEPENEAALAEVAKMPDGTPLLINREVLAADTRILTGFIEPHFFAGFSGGPKAILPGVAGLRSVIANHRAANIAHPQAAFGVTGGNPLWEEMQAAALAVGPSFLINVALNHERQITGVFAGDVIAAHRQGCAFVRDSAMCPVAAPFDVVVTTNSGYPLDLNLYQGVKGMSAGVRILKPGGLLVMACECREGIPAGSPCEKLLTGSPSPDALLKKICSPGFAYAEQWQVQIQAMIQSKVRVVLHSSLSDATVKSVHLAPCPDIAGAVMDELQACGPQARVAVLPDGPLTIPYLA
jgi:nickel-dependent lactate racemase